MPDQAAVDFLVARRVGVLGTTRPDGSPQTCTFFYVCNSECDVLFKSRAESGHMRSLENDPRAAVSIYHHESSYKQKAGLQLVGVVRRLSTEIEMREAVDLYSASFDGAAAKFAPLSELVAPDAASTMFAFVPQAYKLTDGWADRADLEYQDW
jgi:uncharacterized protein YhbP (UPF0306 family)